MRPPPSRARLPARKWRDLIRQAWHSDPWQCPVCSKEMHLIVLIEDPAMIEKILQHLKLRCGPARFAPARPPPSTELPEPEPEFLVDHDPMPDYDDVITD